MSLCCQNCFDHKFLKDYITRHGSIGSCEYCGSSGVFCISVSSLTDLFDPVVDLYEPLERGKHYIDEDDLYGVGSPLAELLNGDWEIFSDKLIDGWSEDKLIGNIINSTRKPKDSIDTGGLWVPKDQAFTYSSLEERWEQFANYIKRERRFVLSLPKYKNPSKWLQHRLLIAEFNMPEGSHLFRARRGYKSNGKGKKCPFDLIEMGPPKPNETKGGRANPPGIPFLYVALDQETAVAEIRPWKGAIVSVARLVLLKETAIINLANIPPLETPFGIKNLRWVLECREMLGILGEKLSTPIDPQASEIEYVPTQYLTELIRDLRYEGILYKSALGLSNNLVLFNPNAARVESAELMEVTDVHYSIEAYSPHHD